MVPPKVNENTSMDVAKIFSTLANGGSSLNHRQQAYSSLTRYLKEEDGLNNPYIQERKDQLLKFLLQDSLVEKNDVVRDILQILQFYITNGSSSYALNESAVLQILLRALKGDHSEEVNHAILNCLALQNFQPAVFTSEIPVLIERLEDIHGRKRAHREPFVERLVDTIFRLEEQLGQSFTSNAARFILLVIHGLTHPLQDTRMKSLELIRKQKSLLIRNADFAKQLVKMINSDFSKNLKTFLSKDCEHLTKVWSMLLDLVGKNIHKGSTINILLQVIEPAFKGQAEARILAFRAWNSLVDNFALDPDVICEPKRIRLLMMVMKVDNAKTEAVAMAKLTTWWHFVCKISSKLSTNFEQVIYPLLQFCAGNSKLHSSSSQHVSSPWMTFTMTGQGNQGPTRGINQSFHDFPVLQKAGCEIVCHILSKTMKGDVPLTVSWTFDPLPADVFTSPASFVKHVPFLMSAIFQLFKNVGPQIQESLVLHIWRSLSNQLRWAMDSMKMECRDAFSTFLSHLHAISQSDLFKEELLFKMLLTSCNFSQKILASTAFNVVGGNVRGCPALLLTEILFMPVIVKYSSSNEHYIKLFSSLVNAGVSNSQGALVFLQSVTDLVNSRVHDFTSSDFLWRLWSTIAHTLHEHINTTNEVNQGDALEYNFGCLYAVLLLPIKKQMSSKVSQAVSKTILRTWRDIYHTFARLSALVATAEANSCLEELSSKIIQSWQPEFKDPLALEFLSSVCQKMLDCIDFSALSVSQSPGSGLTLSPGKWAKRRTRPMANLHSFVHLVAKIQSEINDLLTNLNEKKLELRQDNLSASISLAVHAVVEICTALFSHITTGLVSHVIATVCPLLSRLYRNETKTGSVKLFVPSLMMKLEKLWQEIVNCITGRYSDQYDSHFLSLLSPMLEATFLHNRRGIKNQTLTLWSSTFSRSPSLVYPDNLKSVLSKVKEKTALVLPGWIISPEQVVNETPFTELSQMSQGDSQIPIPVLPGLPSPKRQPKGSFISRDISPARPSLVNNHSPAKIVSPKEVRSLFSSSRKNVSMDLNMMSEKEFVVISSPPKGKRRLLTEHQKEVLKEKSVIPAMYNNLDASIDVSLSNFNDTQQESLSSMAGITRQESRSNHAQEPNILANEQLPAEGKQQSFKDLSGDTSSTLCSNISRFPQAARRSVRILEMKSDNGEAKLTSTRLNAEEKPELNSRRTKLRMEASNESSIFSDSSKKSTKRVSTVSQVDVKEKACDNLDMEQMAINTEKEKKNETEPAAFKMFRTRSQNLESGMPKTIEEPEETPKAHSRKVPLRKVQSDESALSSDKTAQTHELAGVGKGKSPRRVPLHKLNEQASLQVEKKEELTILSLTSSTLRLQESEAEPEGDKRNSSTSNYNMSVKSTLRNWLVRGEKNIDKAVSLRTVIEKSPPSEQALLPCQDKQSVTLVEDTQSPRKMCGEENENMTSHECIAETPSKSDDSPSPRTTRSARKLFSDLEVGEGPSKTASCQPNVKEKDHEQTSTESGQRNVAYKDTEVPLFDSDSVISSSQGFSVTLEMPKNIQEIAETPLSSVVCSYLFNGESRTLHSIDESTVSNNNTYVPQSETVLDSPAQTAHSSDDMSMMAMPTLASQSGQAISKSTESSSSAKTSSSDESSNKKLTPSIESDFNLSQSTLKDECNEKTVKERTTLSTHLRLEAKIKKNCLHDGTISVLENQTKQDPSQSVILDNTQDNQTPHEAVNQKDRLQQFTVIDKKPSEENSEKKTSSEIPVIGEVTPDVKSPSELSPVKRSSTTKNRRRAAKRLSDHLNEISREGVDEVSSSAVLENDSSGTTDISESKNKFIKTQSLHRRHSAFSSPRTVRSKHLLRTRTKVVRRLSASPPALSPPKRRRILKRVHREKSDIEDADDLPLSCLKKRRMMTKTESEDTDDENKPLSSFVTQKDQTEAEAACSLSGVTQIEEEAACSLSVVTQKNQTKKEAASSLSLVVQKDQNEEEAACTSSVVMQKYQNEVKTACSLSLVTQKNRYVEEAACLSTVVTQKNRNVEEADCLSTVVTQKNRNVEEAACLWTVVTQKDQNVEEADCLSTVVTQKNRNVEEAACLSTVVTLKNLNVEEAACLSTVVTQKDQNVEEAACLSSVVIQKVEEAYFCTDDKEKIPASENMLTSAADEKESPPAVVILNSVSEKLVKDEEMDASEVLILSSEIQREENHAEQFKNDNVQPDNDCVLIEKVSEYPENNLKQIERSDIKNDEECVVIETVPQNPDNAVKQSDLASHQYENCADIHNVHVDNTDVQVLADAESIESDSPSLLAHAPQVTVSSQEDEKMEVVAEPSQESNGSDEVFEKEKQTSLICSIPTAVFDKSMPKHVEEIIITAGACNKDEKVEKTTEEAMADEVNESEESTPKTPVKEKEELEQEDEYIPSQWSPSKSPSCSILKKPTPVSDKQPRRVSFAEPVVSGESPVREKYHAESLPTSPLISHNGLASTKFSRSSSSPGKLMNRGTPYRRRLEGSLRKNESNPPRQRNSSSQTSSLQSQNSYKATQESQLDAVNPIFPDLVDCKASLDCILPQLTSSLWHRGLCQLMKGRNLHTIGDLSSLTEVQINQMPIRHPKVQTVRDTLMAYLNQHGNSKGSKSIFACAATPLHVEACSSPKSSGATLQQEVTPSSIADEGIKILPNVEEDLSELSPIRDPNLKCDEEVSQLQASNEVTASNSAQDETQAGNEEEKVISSLSSFIAISHSGMKDVSMTGLFDIHQKLNTLLGVVVEEMKVRQTELTKSKT